MTIELIKRVHGPVAALRHAEEVHAQLTDLGIEHRAIFAAKLVHEMRAETHVVVGDHTPEPR